MISKEILKGFEEFWVGRRLKPEERYGGHEGFGPNPESQREMLDELLSKASPDEIATVQRARKFFEKRQQVLVE